MLNAIMLDPYVVDVLMPDLVGHDRRPAAFLVYLLLWARTVGARRKGAHLSYQRLVEGTGLSKSAVQTALKTLKRRQLVRVEKGSPTSVPHYQVCRPWVR
jgi:hypothetical protein